MDQQSHPAKLVSFGVFEADLGAGELRKNGRKVRIQELPLRILAMLVERPREVITRVELRERLWSDAYVDFDRSLNTAVAKLREALGDSAESPRFVETLPRRGYRFLADVAVVGEPVVTRREQAPEATGAGRKVTFLVAALAVAVVIAGAVVVRHMMENSPGPPLAPVPLTSDRGVEIGPSFSPDGSQIAYCWNGGPDENFDIYVRPVAGGEPLRITENPAPDVFPSWSPEGDRIAFVRHLEARRSIVVLVPALGGAEQPLAEIVVNGEWWAGPAYPGMLSWSPDGNWLAVTDWAGGLATLTAIDTATGEMRPITTPQRELERGGDPSFSPDGRRLAYFEKVAAGTELVLLPLTGDVTVAGDPKRIPVPSKGAMRPTWTPDGKEIVFLDEASSPNERRLWRVNTAGNSEADVIASLPPGATYHALSKSKNLLAFSRWRINNDLWEVDLTVAAEDRLPRRSPASSTWYDANAWWSPDGERIVFASQRSGVQEIWVCNRDGSHATQLTSLDRNAGSPRWSPDGESIVFNAAFDIYRVSSHGGEPRQLTTHSGKDQVPSYSADGQWIYFDSDRSGAFEVWMIPADGGTPERITRDGGRNGVESPDGNWLYFIKGPGPKREGEHDSLWRGRVRDGIEELVVDKTSAFLRFDVKNSGIYYVVADRRTIEFLDFETGETTEVIRLERRPYTGLSVSPDGKTLLFSQKADVEADLMLVEGFR